MSWFGWKGDEKEGKEGKEGKSKGDKSPRGDGDEESSSGGGGWMNYMKGLLGFEDLKVEDTGDEQHSKKADPDAEKRKGLFKTLSSFIGKDVVSLVSLPVWIFEPMSFLQVMAEPLQYDDLLKKAAACPDPYLRLAYVAGFQCGLYNTAVRTKKPFNPLLGETFEIVSEKHGFKFLAEQVSHHPPIGVSETTHPAYDLQLETELHTKLYGNSSEVIIHGTNHLDLKPVKEHYSWGHLSTYCHNIIIGSLWLDHFGELVVRNDTTGAKCVMKFTKAGWLGAGRYHVNGEIFDPEGKLRMKVQGKWSDSLRATPISEDGQAGEEVVVWESFREQPNNKYNFTKFIEEEIINIPAELEKVLPPAPYPLGPTDSRLREDRRLLEQGDMDAAGKAKHQMEEVQRAQRKEREGKSEPWTPRYFEKVPDDKFEYRWKFNGKYWEERAERAKQHGPQ